MFDSIRARFKAQPEPASPQNGHHHDCTPGVDCEDCPNQESGGATVPLCLVGPHERARIAVVDEGRRFRKRLADLGLAVGMEVRVLHAAHHNGPMILAVRHDARLAVGWGMASKIRVHLVAPDA